MAANGKAGVEMSETQGKYSIVKTYDAEILSEYTLSLWQMRVEGHLYYYKDDLFTFLKQELKEEFPKKSFGMRSDVSDDRVKIFIDVEGSEVGCAEFNLNDYNLAVAQKTKDAQQEHWPELCGDFKANDHVIMQSGQDDNELNDVSWLLIFEKDCSKHDLRKIWEDLKKKRYQPYDSAIVVRWLIAEGYAKLQPFRMFEFTSRSTTLYSSSDTFSKNPLIIKAAKDKNDEFKNHICKVCGSNVSEYENSSALIKERPEAKEWEFYTWIACDNYNCIYGYGEHRDYELPDWVEKKNHPVTSSP